MPSRRRRSAPGAPRGRPRQGVRHVRQRVRHRVQDPRGLGTPLLPSSRGDDASDERSLEPFACGDTRGDTPHTTAAASLENPGDSEGTAERPPIPSRLGAGRSTPACALVGHTAADLLDDVEIFHPKVLRPRSPALRVEEAKHTVTPLFATCSIAVWNATAATGSSRAPRIRSVTPPRSEARPCDRRSPPPWHVRGTIRAAQIRLRETS